MFRVLCLGLIFLLAAFAVQAEVETDNSEPEISSALLRMALVVSDVEASKRFYAEGLGYRVGFDGDITRPSVAAMLGLEDGQTAHFVVLHGAKSLYGEEVDSAMVGLLHVDNPPLPAMGRPASLAVGEGMMAIMSDNIALAHERMQTLGAKILFPPTLAADGSESEMVVHDPDGIRIHVVERHQKPPTADE